LRRLANAPFAVKGYNCPECLVGVDADRFAFLATVLLIKTKYAKEGFKKVILILGEKYANAFPDKSVVCQIIAGRRPRDWAHFLWKRVLPDLLPFLAILRRKTYSQTCTFYQLPPEQRMKSHGNGKPRVVIVATDSAEFSTYYSRPAVSIARACMERGHEVLVVTNPEASAKLFEDSGLESTLLRKTFVGELGRIWWKTLRARGLLSREFCGSRKADDADLCNLAAELVKEGAAPAAIRIAGGITLFDEIFARFRPDVLVSIPDSSFLGMAAISVARKLGISSLTTLAGQIFDHPQYGFLNADLVAVNGNLAKEVFLKRGVSPKRVVVTGMAHYDETFALAKSLRPTKAPGIKLVVFATENLPLGETMMMLKPVVDFVVQSNETRLLIRTHPRENPDNYKEYLTGLGTDRVTLDNARPLHDLLAMADVCVTGFSNVAVEAMIMNRPVLCINFSGRPDKLGYVRERAAVGVNAPDQVAPALVKTLFDESTIARLALGRIRFLKKNFYRADGNASRRIAVLVERLARKHRRRRRLLRARG